MNQAWRLDFNGRGLRHPSSGADGNVLGSLQSGQGRQQGEIDLQGILGMASKARHPAHLYVNCRRPQFKLARGLGAGHYN